ncbi:MAG: DUF1553 domain-containing protein [Planctomycetaceae bacterium]|nr:DUF1553 domain-containing protein [Planctomycetaceae bacterium]
MNRRCVVIAGFIAGCLAVADGRADDRMSQTGETFDESAIAAAVQQLFANRCLECHGDTEPEGGLRLTSRANVLQLNDSGVSAVVEGKSDQSELVRRVTIEGDERMPPDGEPLAADEVELLKHWIDAGVPWTATKEQVKHWAYLKPVRPTLPEVTQRAWVRNELDTFVLHRLEAHDPPVTPSPSTEPATLLRRVYLDLIGLPPSVAEVDAFLDDPSPAHYEQIVDRLLDSPRYGEKWARSWLDLARYADSNGFQADQYREMWAYRDWVVAALNADMPFDQYTIEQIAGDLLPDATMQQKIATGFHRCTTCNVEAGVDPEENRTNQIVDRVNTTGTVWLGTTLECAQCHNHKYDPFTQQDYYQLFAFFNNTPLEVKLTDDKGVSYDTAGPEMELPWTEEQRREQTRLKEEVEAVRKRVDERRQQLEESFTEWQPDENAELPDGIRELITKPVDERTDEDRKQLFEHYLTLDAELTKLNKQLESVETQLEKVGPSTTLVMIEQDEPRMTAIFKRGNFLDRGVEVKPMTPAVLHKMETSGSDDERSDRLAMARWLVSEENPLVARVTVNRWWAEMFGRGIVETVEDFGVQGARPTHPQLLDWLAVEFMENGWSMKHIHRAIVMSATYQQDSSISPEQLEFDPANKWLARGPRFRLPAETIRDNALAVAGLLTDRLGGPPVYPPQPPNIWRHAGRNPPVYDTDTDEDRFRRGLYVIWRRSAPYPSFVNFDAPDRAASCVKRSVTNTPLQALTLLNDPAYYEMAAALAEHMLHDLPDEDDRARIEYGFRRSVARQPSSDEVSILHQLYEAELSRQRSKQGAESSAEVTEDLAVATEAAAWISVANALLNLDETITKE